MADISGNFYAHWRARHLSCLALREDLDTPPELLLQAVWQQQRLLRHKLKTLDGETVHVLHPGFKNHEAGPDFRGAIVQIGPSSYTGDVEIDLRVAGWRGHGHDGNPAFKNVVLHVIWDGDNPAVGGMPTMALRGKLDAPLAELNSWLHKDTLKSLPESLRGKCGAPLSRLPAEHLGKLLNQAAQIRWEGKAAHFHARSRQVGWEQSLWEGIFRALGYKQNIWPMQRLAELRPLWSATCGDAMGFQARLFGLSGLLPVEFTRSSEGMDKYLKRIWDEWWRERNQFSEAILPRELWRFNSLRPANHPQRRLALAAHWLAQTNFTDRLEKWFLTDISDSALAESLLDILRVESDDFWSWHWTFRSKRLLRAQPMIGAARVTDLAINVILPWFWLRAREGQNEKLQQEALRRYLAWPAAEDNRVLKLARERLLGGRKTALKSAAAQQGLLQILRDFCDNSNAVCENCDFPDLVRNFAVV